MGSERATIEELEMIHSPMQLNSPAHVAMDAGNLDDNDMDDSGDAGGDAGGGAGEPMSRDQRQQIQDLIRGRGPSLFNELEQLVDQAGADQENDSDDDSDGDSDDNGGRQSSAPLIQEEAQEPERLSSRSSGAPLIEEEEGDEVAAAEAPALDKSQLRPDVLGARDLAENAGATPGRNWVEAGEILQGDANSARRRGEGRYGAAALHGIADLAVSAGSGEAGGAAAGVVKGAMKPLAAPAMVGKLAIDAVKYTVGGLVSAGGQAVQKIGDNKRDALDPEGLLEQQRLVDVANRHEYGIDMTSEKQGLTRREEVAARGVRMEQGDKAKKIWNGPKKRSWGRVTQNAIAAPFRGIGKAVKSLVTSPAAGLKSTVNFFSKYGRKAVNGISNIFNRKRRANNALERLRERSAANGEDRYPAAPANALKADSPLKQGTYNFRGGEASIRSHTRDVRKAQGFDNILGQKDYEKLSEADRREYKDKEKTLLTESPKYLGANDKVASDSNIIKGIAQKFAEPDAQDQGDQQQAPANIPPRNAVAEASNDDFEMIPDNYASNFGKPELAKDSHPGMSIAEGIKKGVGVGEQLVETSKKLDAPVGIVTNFLGQQLPDMLEGQALEDYAPHAESAKAVGDTFKSINENAALYRAPLIGKGLNTGFDLYKTAKQSANRDKDANKTALNERQTLEDTREMSDRVRALLQEKKDAGASKESIARTSRLRNKMLMLRLVTANRKLAKAQEMNSITPLNEYSKKESDFIGTGDYTKDKEVGAKGVGELGKEAGKATVKTLKAVIGYGGANKADDSKEADRLYGPGGKFQGADAVADQNVIEEIEDEEKHASGELNAGGDSQLGAAAAHQNVIKEEVNRESDELNPMHNSDTHSYPQRQTSYPQRQRPSQVDFNVSDTDDESDGAVSAGGRRVNIDQSMSQMDDDDFVSEEEKDEPNELPPWITQIEGSEGEEFHSRARFSGGVKGKEPSADGKERVLAGHRGDITVDHQKVEPQYPNKGSDPEKPFGGVWRRADTKQAVQQAGIFGSNPDELYPNGEFHDEPKVEFQGGILEKEKILAAPQAHNPAPAREQDRRVIEEEEKDAPVNLDTANRVRPDLSSQGMIHAPGGGAKIDQPSDAGLDPDLLAQMNQFEGAENGMDGNPQGESIRRISDFHDSVRSDGTTMERMGSVADDFQEQPMGEQGPQEPALGSGPMLNQLIDGQWQMMPEEEKGAAPVRQAPAGRAPRSSLLGGEPAGAVGSAGQPEVLDTGAGGLKRNQRLMDPRELALLTGSANPARTQKQLPAIKSAVENAQGANTTEEATAAWKEVDKLQRGVVNRRWSGYRPSDPASIESAGARMESRRDLMGERMLDVSTRHEGLDLPEAQMPDRRLQLGGDDQSRIAGFEMPGAEFNMFQNPDHNQMLDRVMESDPNRALPGRRQQVQEKMHAFQQADAEKIDVSKKRVLDDNNAFTADAQARMGEMTVDDQPVYPSRPNLDVDADQETGGAWRRQDTDQIVQRAGIFGAGGRSSGPFGSVNEGNQFGEFVLPAIAEDQVLQKPAAGWDAKPNKPGWGWFAAKAKKDAYQQAKKSRQDVVAQAYSSMRKDLQPRYIKQSDFGRQEWTRLEAQRKARDKAEEKMKFDRENLLRLL